MKFTGIKDIDLEILSKLDDSEIGKLCSTNKYFRNLCKDDVFWRNRTIKRFGKYLGNAETLNTYRNQYNIPTWRLYYISLIDFLDRDYFKNDRKDLLKLHTLKEKNNNNFEEQLLDNYDKYKWKEILKEELFDPNKFGYISELEDEDRKEYLEYILNSENKRIDPNEALDEMLYLSFDEDKHIIEKYLKDPRTSIEKIINSVVIFSGKFINEDEDEDRDKEYSVLDLYLDIIKGHGGVERLIHKIETNKFSDDETVAHIFDYLGINILPKIYDILKNKIMTKSDQLKILKFLQNL
jgi:hypothetical protein